MALHRLAIDRKSCTPILLVALFVRFGAELLLLAIRNGADTVRVHTGRYQRLFGCVGAILAESQVVFSRSASVAVAADDDLQLGMLKRETPRPLRRRSAIVG